MAAKQEPRDLLGEAAALLLSARMATLATVDGEQPHASLVTPALGADAAPLLLLSGLAAHTRHLAAHPLCALLVVGEVAGDNPQTARRLTLQGRAAITDDPDARARYLTRHPYAAGYAGFADFAVWRLEIGASLYIGGFGVAVALDHAALRQRIMSLAGW